MLKKLSFTQAVLGSSIKIHVHMLEFFLTNWGNMELSTLVSCAWHWKYFWGCTSLGPGISISFPSTRGANKEHFQHLLRCLFHFISDMLSYNSVNFIRIMNPCCLSRLRIVYLLLLSSLTGGSLKVTTLYLTASLTLLLVQKLPQ